ncbi:unnamed protein product [Peniophora sp. CBMAI 1063]|nr:unnamed protein product [Peniophora sp. CBMAI 1063]
MVLARALTFCVRLLSTSKHHPTWEVVDSKSVDPVHAWDCDDMDDSDAEILAVHGEDIVRSYIFEVRSPGDVSKAVSAAQHRLLQEARTMGYNALWREGWQMTLFRQGSRLRIEVRYTAMPASLSAAPLKTPRPPFIGVLNQRMLTH